MKSAPRLYEKIESSLGDDTRPVHYLIAIGFVIIALVVRWNLPSSIIHGFGFILFYPAVVAAAWVGGFRPGLLATAVAAAVAATFYMPPPGTPDAGATAIVGPFVIFLASSTFMCALMGIMHHIVAKERGQRKEIYDQREWLRVILTSIGDAVIVTDRNGTVGFMNGESERLTGWSIAEAKNKPLRSIFRIISEESRKSVDDPVEKVFREKRVVGLANHTLLISKDGIEWPIEDSASPIYDEKRDILGVVLVFHDATELRRNQRALKAHADELEHKVFERTVALQRTVNDLEAFSYTVSHDLRSPLRAMLGYSQALLEDFPQVPDEAKDYLQRISRSAERLDRLIQELLAFSRISHDADAISSINLDRLVRDIIEQYPNFSNHKSDISIEGHLPTVLGHETALTQVVSNLLGNALKFASPGRPVQVRIHSEIKEHVIRLYFIDNGIGIAPENQERIFKMFEQINPPGQYAGTGVGLAVVRKAVEKMQGTMGVESVLGEGSKFWIELLKSTKK